jgi:hypothetical protein
LVISGPFGVRSVEGSVNENAAKEKTVCDGIPKLARVSRSRL